MDNTVRYPASSEFFSPDERFPEYAFGHISGQPNPVYRAVRTCLAQAGLDRERYGTAIWNPLSRYILPGSRVFVLCNFVYHRRSVESQKEYFAKCTHGSVLRALLDYVLLAVGNGGRVVFGNAPLQSCRWEDVLADTGASAVLDFYTRERILVQACDLRLFISERNYIGNLTRTWLLGDEGKAVTVDLVLDSFLDELYAVEKSGPHFRVSDYDPRRTESFHSFHNHRYVINREILDTDVVISLPKLKTHEKVGITCGLKGFVGAVGHKDCLAHHRFGNPCAGGDEYPNGSRLSLLLSRFHDFVQRQEPKRPFPGVLHVADRFLRHVSRRVGLIQAGAWSGNDTAWRMALDLSRIMHYADSSGRMQNAIQRRHLSLIDGVIGGEGNGPLSPRPADCGTLIFSDNVAAGDRVACRVMGYDMDRVPIVREAFRTMRYPLAEGIEIQNPICWNGRQVKEGDIPAVLQRPFLPPVGWRDHLISKA